MPQIEAAPPSGLGFILRSIWTVLEFEFKKSRTWKRMLIWLAVAMFPAFIIFLMLFSDEPLPRAGWVTAIFVMACEMVVILNAMLWVAPIVQTELEGKTWLYVAARPYGRICLVVGKLLNGLVWTLGAGLVALSLIGAVAWINALPIEGILGEEQVTKLTPEQEQAQKSLRELRRELRMEPPEPEAAFNSVGDALGVGGILALLALLAGLAYSSLFCGIGCIIPKRAMLIAFSYTLVFETVVAFVPAIINRLTIQYHLRCLLNRWIDLEVPEQGQELFFSNWPAWWHVSVLCGMIAFWQIVSIIVIHYRQYFLVDEN
jgi:hypothetical protein